MREILYKTSFSTPLGKLVAIASDYGLCFLEYDIPTRCKLLTSRLNRWFPDSVINKSQLNFHLWQTQHWINNYFEDAYHSVTLPIFDLRGSHFELSVWSSLKQLKVGETCSYGLLASTLLKKGGAQAVGGAVGRNPVSIIIPCHRVIGKKGDLIGYGGGTDKKEFLLRHEQAVN